MVRVSTRYDAASVLSGGGDAAERKDGEQGGDDEERELARHG